MARTFTTEAPFEKDSKGKRVMTLDALAKFVQDAMRQEYPGDSVIKVDINWGCTVKEITITTTD